MLPDKFTINWGAVNARNYSSLGALVFTLAEYAMTIHLEYRFIWKWRKPLWSAKGLYLLSRYYAIVAQIVHYCLVHMYLNRGPVQPHQCRAWFFFLTTSTSVLLATLDTLLLLRVYALYKKNVKIYMLLVPLLLQYAMASLLLGRHAFRPESFSPHCDMMSTPPFEVGILGGIVMLCHLALWFATFWKRREASEAAAARLVVHEGGWTFGALTLYMAGILPYCFVTQSGNPFAVFIWPMVVISITCCRMVINMCELSHARSLRQENGTCSSPSSILTSYFNTHFTIEEIQMDQPKEASQQGPVAGSSSN